MWRDRSRLARLSLVGLVIAIIFANAAPPWTPVLARSRPAVEAAPVAAPAPAPMIPDHAAVRNLMAGLPLSFIPNAGQFDPAIHFQVRGQGHSLLFGASRLTVVAQSRPTLDADPTDPLARFDRRHRHLPKFGSSPAMFGAETTEGWSARQAEPAIQTDVITISFPGARPDVAPEGDEPLPGKVNYFIGNDSDQWHTDVPTFGATRYRDLYPGIDLVYRGQTGRLKGEWLVAPGADSSLIRLSFCDANATINIDDDGNLHIATARGELVDTAPEAFQMLTDSPTRVGTRYSVIDQCQVGFDVGAYDQQVPLVIDPALVYSTYLGGSGDDQANALAVDSAGAIYVAGSTNSTNFPTSSGAFQSTLGAYGDAFVTKLNPVATGAAQLIYSTYLGGNSTDNAYALAVDSAGAIYVAGITASTNFPISSGAFQSILGGNVDAFVTKLNPVATGAAQLVYSTYLGGDSTDHAYALAVDSAGGIYVAGITPSINFPTSSGAFQSILGGNMDAFVTKLNPVATGAAQLVYSTYLGGNGSDQATALAVDSAGIVYVAGYTYSTNFPTSSGAFQSTLDGFSDAFVTKLDISGPPPGGYSISGVVRDVRNQPVQGVIVTAPGGGTATTNASGAYTLTGLAAGNYTLSARKSGSTPSKDGWTFKPSTLPVAVGPSQSGKNFFGYDRPPVVLVSGINTFSCAQSDFTYFGKLKPALEAAGFFVQVADIVSSCAGTPPIDENAIKVGFAVAAAKFNTGQNQVHIVAHSMGGLASRGYIETLRYGFDVDQFITLGTPHDGTPIAVNTEALIVILGSTFGGGLGGAGGALVGGGFNALHPGLADMGPGGIKVVNAAYRTRRAGVNYHLVAGAIGAGTSTTVAGNLGSLFTSAGATFYGYTPENDGAVPKSSSEGSSLGLNLDRFDTNEVHNGQLGTPQYFQSNANTVTSVSYTDCILPLLNRQKTNCGVVTTAPARRAPTAARSISVGVVPIQAGVILPGQVLTRTIQVDAGPAVFTTQWQTGTLGVRLVSPANQVIDAVYALANPSVVSYTVSATSAQYALANAAAGSWRLVADATGGLPVAGTAYSTLALITTDVTLAGAVDHPWYAPNATAVISATLTGAATGVTVTAQIQRADNVTDTVPLAPLGGGRYQANYVAPAASGHAIARIVAQGTANGAPFERVDSVGFQITSNAVTLTGGYSDAPTPRVPGSSLYSSLNVSATVTSAFSGTAGLAADLVDLSGNPVAKATTSQAVTTGTNTVALRFDGVDIFQSQRNGPYRLTHVLLTDLRQGMIVAQEAQNVYTTATYQYNSFNPNPLGNLKFLTNPVRVVDTRPLYVNNSSGQLGGTSPTGYQPNGSPIIAGPFDNGETRRFKIAGQSFGNPATAVPTDTTGVLINVTILQPPGAPTGGFTVAYPGDANAPTAATVNPADPVSAGLVLAVNQNFAVVGLSPSPSGAGTNPGTVAVTSVGQPFVRDLVIDLVGYYAPSNPATVGQVKFIPPVRVLDTRPLYNATGDGGGVLPIGFTAAGAPIAAGPIAAGAVNAYGLANRAFGSITQTNQITFPVGITGVLAHITTLQPPGLGGFTTLLPGDAGIPGTATLNPVNGISFNSWANGIPTAGPKAGAFGVFSTLSHDVIVDVMGYFSASNPSLTPTLINPVRVVDTRGIYNLNGATGNLAIGFDENGAPITPGAFPATSTTRRYKLNGQSFGYAAQGNQILFPADAKGALMNVSTVQSSAPTGGFLTVFPGDASPAGLAATVNASLKVAGSWWASGLPNTPPLFPGTIGVFSTGFTRDLIIDASAYFR